MNRQKRNKTDIKLKQLLRLISKLKYKMVYLSVVIHNRQHKKGWPNILQHIIDGLNVHTKVSE